MLKLIEYSLEFLTLYSILEKTNIKIEYEHATTILEQQDISVHQLETLW